MIRKLLVVDSCDFCISYFTRVGWCPSGRFFRQYTLGCSLRSASLAMHLLRQFQLKPMCTCYMKRTSYSYSFVFVGLLDSVTA